MDFPDNLTRTVLIDASVVDVWQVMTTPELVEQWISEGGVTVSSNYMVGSPILFSGKVGSLKIRDKGTILVADPGKRLSYNYWSRISRLKDIPENYVVVDLRLEVEGDGTRLTLSVTNIAEITYKHWEFYWNVAVLMLKRVAETRVIIRP